MGNVPEPAHKEAPLKQLSTCQYIWNDNDVVGTGELSTVYKGKARRTLQTVAIKRTPPHKLTKSVSARLNSEASILTTIRNIPHSSSMLLQLRDGFVDEEGGMCIATEFIEGEELFAITKTHPHGIPEGLAKVIAFQILSAVDMLHQNDIAHLDLKLENIMIDRKFGNRIKLIDFGFAAKTARFHHGTQTKHPVKLKYFRGSPHYVSPELIKQVPYDGTKADVWSVGVILYGLIFGRFPFYGQTRKELFEKIVSEEHQPDICDSDLSPDGRHFLNLMFTYDPEERPSVSQLLQNRWLNSVRDPEGLSDI